MKKLGKVRVSQELYLQNYDIVKSIFNFLQPLSINQGQNFITRGDFEIIGVCDSFDEIKEGEEIPFYDCLMKTLPDNTVQISFNRL